jgi:hypothetical protein
VPEQESQGLGRHDAVVSVWIQKTSKPFGEKLIQVIDQ